MTTTPTLVFAVIHGIGPQPSDLHEQFVDKVWIETDRYLRETGHVDLAETLTNRLAPVRAHWSDLYMATQMDWVAHLFPRLRDHSRRAVWKVIQAAVLRLVLYLAVGAVVYVVAGGIGSRLPGVPWNRWVLAALAGLVAVLLEEWLWGAYRFPWGSLWMLGRGFEAFTLSDIILYGSDDPRNRIRETILDQIEEALTKAPPRGIGKGTEGSGAGRIPVFLAGHSQGSVIAYDLLENAAQDLAQPGNSAAEREFQRLQREYDGAHGASAEERLQTDIKYMQRLVNLIHSLYPVGMITFGSPVALFLFRKPDVARRQDGWQDACPPDFRRTGEHQGLRWRWQNFWHASDFVAHRLEPFFNQGFPASPAKFVEDIETRRPVRHPVEAHSSYWDDRHVVRTAGRHVAECVIALDKWP